VAIKRFGVKAPLWIKLASVSGLLVSVIGGFFTMVPITPVDSRLLFAAKIVVVVVAANVIGMALYWIRRPAVHDAPATQ
jgi:hypothetical protein